jgi:aromatic-L-amino-acid decarboxylase
MMVYTSAEAHSSIQKAVELRGLGSESLRPDESGVAAPSYTTLAGRYALRAAITNRRSRREDFDLLVREVVRLGHVVAAERMAGG